MKIDETFVKDFLLKEAYEVAKEKYEESMPSDDYQLYEITPDRFEFSNPLNLKISSELASSSYYISFNLKDNFFYKLIDSACGLNSFLVIYSHAPKEIKKLPYNDKVKYFYENSYSFRLSHRYFAKYQKRITYNIFKEALDNILASTSYLDKHKIKINISSKKFSPIVKVEVIINEIVEDLIFGKNEFFDSKTNNKIVKALKKYYPNINIDENLNINNVYFKLRVGYASSDYIGMVINFNKNTNSIKFKVYEIIDGQPFKKKSYWFKLTKTNYLGVKIEVDNNFKLHKNIDLI